MYDLIIGGIVLTSLYFLFIKGHFFRAAMWMFGYYGLAITLDRLSFLQPIPIVAFSYSISWGYLISFFITVAAIITTKYSQY